MEFRAFADQELTALAARLADAAQRQTDAATARQTTSFQTTIDRLRTDHAQVVSDNERLTAENAALVWERDDLLARCQRGQRHSLIASLSEAFDSMALGASVGDIVVATAGGLLGELARVAAFTISDNRFELRYSHGFEEAGGSTPIASDAVQAFLAQAVKFDTVRRWPAETLGTATRFGGPPTAALTATLGARGEMVAILYADDAGADSASDRLDECVKVAEMLRRHAILALERLTVELKATAELRAYAKMLLDEVEYVYGADVAARMGASERQTRMRENVRCAKQIYGQRVAVEGPTASTFLDEHIARAIADKAATSFGQDLALAVAGAPMAADAAARPS